MASRRLHSISILLLFLACCCCSVFTATSDSDPAYVDDPDPAYVDDPDLVAQDVDWSIQNSTSSRKLLGSCATGNPIDDCWRCDSKWEKNRKKLADCAIGFGKKAIGGRNGDIYVVTDASDDNPNKPKRGTLRYGVVQKEPLWIVFERDMKIKLKKELLMKSHKTLDGRGANVHISGGGCIAVRYASNIIIHGLHIHDCKPKAYDGDGVGIVGGSHVWVDHNSFANCQDGLVDVTRGSKAVTISNNYFTRHNKVMLLGHSDSFTADKKMQVTVAFNRFGKNLGQRMPRCRHGYVHVVNNDYPAGWVKYAVGGSAAPTINSQGNRFRAPGDSSKKQVTKRMYASEKEWKRWNWRSVGDKMLNGAFFVSSGSKSSSSYSKATSLKPKSSSLVPAMTASAGALSCKKGSAC